MSQGSLLILFTRPIAGAISAVAIFFFALPLLVPYWRRRRARAEAPAEAARR